ncbi:MAG: TRAP transporter substrate-binding protein [Bacteroidales bacterium]|nr:TRAP transporter substrate-binding protein [Bacteroidales bacterium]
MKKIIALTLIFTVLLLGGCGLKSDVTVLKLGHTLDTKHSVHIAMAYMAKRVEEISEGKLQVEVYPGGVLGSERESLELLQLGSLDLTKVSAAAMEGFVEEYKVFGLPYMFKSKEHAYSVLDGPIGENMLAKGEEFWLRGLCFYDAGARSFYTARPIHTPTDLSGLKIRVMQSITAVEMIRAMGGSATHYTLNEHTMIPDVMIMSTHAWKKLSDQEKIWLQQAVDESVIVQREEWQKSEDESLRALAEEGVEIIRPDKAPFIKAVEGVYDIYRNNPRVYDLIKEIRAADVPVAATDSIPETNDLE